MKYMGGKSAIAGEILPFIHSYLIVNNCDTYIEPFVGGANIIDKVQCTNRIAYDKNKYLIAFFKHLQDGGELPEDVSREQYNDCREHFLANDKYYPDWYIAAIGFLAGYNGKFFDGGYGGTAIENGKQRDYYQEAKRNVLGQIQNLADVKFDVSDYKDLNPHNSVVYCDPPYCGTEGYLKVSKKFNHSEFWEIMRKWSVDNIVLISEENAPEDFDVIWEKDVARTINNVEKKKSTEKLYIHHSLNSDNSYDF